VRWLLLVTVLGCEPPPSVPAQATAASDSASTNEAEDDCRRDVPDCSAACALRATHHLEFIDWYDRRCAAVILGKNPDKVAGILPPNYNPDASRDDLAPNPYR
jgi:hypothetical protein